VRGIDEMRRIPEGLPGRLEVHRWSGRGSGHHHDLLRPLASRVLVAHAGRLRLIFRSTDTNDRDDAERLAKPLYLGERPTVHLPTPEVRAWRELVNRRGRVIAGRTRARNAVRALVRGAGVATRGSPPRG
jgi:transposase